TLLPSTTLFRSSRDWRIKSTPETRPEERAAEAGSKLSPVRPSQCHDRRPVIIPELRLEFFLQLSSGVLAFHERKRRRAAAGHQRRRSFVGLQNLLEQ